MVFRRKFAARLAAMLMAGAMVLPGFLPAAATATPNTSAVFCEVQIPSQGAQLHYGGGSGSVIGMLEEGTKVELFDATGSWYGVSCDGVNGYVSADQVTEQDGEYYINCQNDSKETRQVQTVADLEAMQKAVVEEAERHLGTPYVWGGKRPGGFDCSGFVYYVYGTMGYSMGYDAFQQLKDGMVVDRDDLQPGDLVFFTGTYATSSMVSHIGIYIGDNQFIHASNRGIAVTELFGGWFDSNYLCARRVLVGGMTVHGITSGIN